MRSLIEEFYHGYLYPNAMPLQVKPDEQKASDEADELIKKFHAMLDEKAWETYLEIESLVFPQTFANGFKLGALFMVEVFTD